MTNVKRFYICGLHRPAASAPSHRLPPPPPLDPQTPGLRRARLQTINDCRGKRFRLRPVCRRQLTARLDLQCNRLICVTLAHKQPTLYIMGSRRLWTAKRRLFTPTLRVFVGHNRSGSTIVHSLPRNKASIEVMKTKKAATTLHNQVLSRSAMHNVGPIYSQLHLSIGPTHC